MADFSANLNENLTVDLIDAAEEARANGGKEYTGYGVSVSRVGGHCTRSLYYDLIWASAREHIKAKTARIFRRGHWEESSMIERMKLAGMEVLEVDPDTGKQFAVSRAKGIIRGKMDGKVLGVPEAPKTWHALEIKSVSQKDFVALNKHGLQKAKREHWYQLHEGMAAHSLSRGLYIAVNKLTDELFAERIRYDAKEATWTEERVLGVVNVTGAPPREQDDPNKAPCAWCKHKDVCHFGVPVRRSCRTCTSFTFTANGMGTCSRWNKHLGPKHQIEACPSHCTIPDLHVGTPVEVDEERHSIMYQMPNGAMIWDGERSDEVVA